MLGVGALGQFALGQPVLYLGWRDRDQQSETWDVRSEDSQTWTERNEQSETWTQL